MRPVELVCVRDRGRSFLLVLVAALIGAATVGQSRQASSAGDKPTLSLSPAVVMLKGQPGQSTTQTLTITNQTGGEFAFDMVAEDVIVRDGKRVFVAAGETPRSIAATAVFNPRSVTVKPHSTGTSNVTVTVPPETSIRAVVAIFRSSTRINSGGVGMTASLGTLLTFTLSQNFGVQAGTLEVQPQTAIANASFRTWLTNTGTEPVFPEGVAAVLTEGGKLVGKTPIQGQRLLPGERLSFSAEYPAQLQPAHYRVLTSFQYEGKTLSLPGTFDVR